MTHPRERLIRLLEASAGKEPKTPAEKLRALLTELEIRVANMEGTGEEVLAIPRLLDEAVALMADLQATGIDLKPEETRLLTVHGLLRSKAGVFVREAQRGRTLRVARADARPPTDHWWWYLDEYVAQQRRARVLRVGVAAVTLVVIVGLVLWFIQSRLPSDPRLRRIIDLETALDTQISEGNIPAAIASLEELRQLDPQNARYAVLLGALYEAWGDEQEAEKQYADARRLIDEGTYRTLRAQAYLQVGLVDKALDEAQRAVELQPQSAEAYFFLGNAHEARGEIPAALQAYERASQLAEAQDNAQLLAIIRVRMAFLLQRLPVPTEEK